MKKGEKSALKWVALIFSAIIVLTVYLELQYQGADSYSKVTVEKSAPQSPSNTKSDVTVIPAGINPEDLPDADSRGAKLLTLYCVQCHEVPTPAMHNKSEWGKVLPRMKTQMQTNRGGMLRRVLMPPEKDWGILTSYLNDHAQTELVDSQLADLESAGGKAFKSTCSQCHAAPSPASHTANEWPRVVLRMKSHILRTGKIMPNQETLMAIISYLQEHSKAN